MSQLFVAAPERVHKHFQKRHSRRHDAHFASIDGLKKWPQYVDERCALLNKGNERGGIKCDRFAAQLV
jgi:hypothetical protein